MYETEEQQAEMNTFSGETSRTSTDRLCSVSLPSAVRAARRGPCCPSVRGECSPAAQWSPRSSGSDWSDPVCTAAALTPQPPAPLAWQTHNHTHVNKARL